MKKYLSKYIGEAILVLSSLAFAFEWFFIRNIANLGYSTFDITFIRALGALAFLSVILPLFFKDIFNFKKIKNTDYKYFLALGVIAIITNILFNLAFQYAKVANVLIILYLAVFWAIIFGFIFLREKSSSKKILFTALAFLGVCLVLVKGETSLALSLGIGELLALLASFFWTADAVISRKIKHTNPFFRMFFIYIIMSIGTFIIINIISGPAHFYSFLNIKFLAYGLGLAVTSGVVGKGLMYLGINYVPVSTAMVIMLLEPVFQMTTAYFFANEKLSLLNILGVVVVFAMVILVSNKTVTAEGIVN